MPVIPQQTAGSEQRHDDHRRVQPRGQAFPGNVPRNNADRETAERNGLVDCSLLPKKRDLTRDTWLWTGRLKLRGGSRPSVGNAIPC